jgi:glycosyltransferase involved in cell wall biosynthesis
MVERKPKEILKKYLQACDFYGQPSFHFVFINFGGFGSATIEALACGLPVISNNIIHFPGTDIERAKIGLTHPTHDDLTKAMLFMKDNFQNYTECRALAQKYFDINDTRYVLLNKYKELISKYYSL